MVLGTLTVTEDVAADITGLVPLARGLVAMTELLGAEAALMTVVTALPWVETPDARVLPSLPGNTSTPPVGLRMGNESPSVGPNTGASAHSGG